MEYTFDTNDRPFKAIKARTKKVEGRTNVDHDKTPYDEFIAGDTINLINNLTNETLKVKVIFIHHYPTVQEMLEKEGPENVLSSEPKTIALGIQAYNAINGYEEGIKKYGIYAIGLELL